MIDHALLVKGVAGLGNRLATLAAALAYARATDRGICVDWSDAMVSDGRTDVFRDYFRLQGVRAVERAALDAADVYPRRYAGRLDAAHNDLYQDTRHALSRRLDRFARLLPRGRAKMLLGYWTPRTDPVAPFWRGLLDPTAFPVGGALPFGLRERTVVFADYFPAASPDVLRAHVAWSDAFAAHLEARRRAVLPDGAVGVHVRFSDKTPRAENVVGSIRARIRALGLGDRPVFLATDSDRIAAEFRRAFPAVRTARTADTAPDGDPYHMRAEARGDPALARAIVRESLVDMTLLADCEWLLYQGNSAFTWASRAWHADPLKQVDWDR